MPQTMSMAADYEFFSRPEWAGLQKAYGLKFRAQRQMQPDFMYAAAASGEVDVIAGYTSDGLIAKYDLVVLDDIRHAIPPYDAIMLLAPKRADDAGAARGAGAAARPDRHRHHARGQSARRRRRRRVVAGCGGALAVGEDREAVNRVGKAPACPPSFLRAKREGRWWARRKGAFAHPTATNAWVYGPLLSQDRRRQGRRGERVPQSRFRPSRSGSAGSPAPPVWRGPAAAPRQGRGSPDASAKP